MILECARECIVADGIPRATARGEQGEPWNVCMMLEAIPNTQQQGNKNAEAMGKGSPWQWEAVSAMLPQGQDAQKGQLTARATPGGEV